MFHINKYSEQNSNSLQHVSNFHHEKQTHKNMYITEVYSEFC